MTSLSSINSTPSWTSPKVIHLGTTTAVPSHTRTPLCCFISFLFLSELVTLSLTQIWTTGFPGGARGKESTCQLRPQFHSRVGKIPWRRKWQPTPAFSAGKFHGQRSLVGFIQSMESKKSQTQLSTKHSSITGPWQALQLVPPAPARFMVNPSDTFPRGCCLKCKYSFVPPSFNILQEMAHRLQETSQFFLSYSG